MTRDSVKWCHLASLSVTIGTDVAVQFKNSIIFHIFQAQLPQKRRNKRPRGGTMRKPLSLAIPKVGRT